MLYPNNLKKAKIVTTTHSNRGMDLEFLINESNEYYLENNIALICKIPTPIGVVKVNYEKQKKILQKGYFKSQATLDYNGIYRGKHLDFDAKETKNKTSFPLSNIHQHQIEYLKKVLDFGGIAFILLSMNNNYYVLPGELIINFKEESKRKSIPFDYIEKNCPKIKLSYQPYLDYLKEIDILYFKGE